MVRMTVPSTSANLSESGSRLVTLEVTGICHPNVMRTGTCTMTVPYDRLSKTLQGIHRLSGKVESVTMVSPLSVAAVAPATTPPVAELPIEQKKRSPKPKRKHRR
jgi:CpcD/allophycocyanin linker domain